MKTNEPNKEDAALRALLKEWSPPSSLPPRFNEQVWRRIAKTETASAPAASLRDAFTNWLATVLPRPALATAYVALLLAIGAGAGWSQARQETARITGRLSARYVQAVDPYQTTP